MASPDARWIAMLTWGVFIFVIQVSFASSAPADTGLTEKWPIGQNACVDTPLKLTFGVPVHLGTTGKITVSRASDRQVVDVLDLSAGTCTDTYAGQSLRVDPITIDDTIAVIHLHSHILQAGETYLVTVDPQVFLDASGRSACELKDSDRWTFTVKSAAPESSGRLVVAVDGTGDFCTVQGALDTIRVPNSERVVIVVKPGVYDGLVRVPPHQDRITLEGEDPKKTFLTALNNDKWNPSAAQRAVVAVQGNDFVMSNLTVRNRTPYLGSQAEAVYLRGDRAVLRDDDFQSFQDTLCLNGRVYLSHCTIAGDVDFIWGYGSVFLDQCEIHALHNGYIVQARNAPGAPGYIFSQCRVTCTTEVKKCWLARIAPETFPASQVAFLHCILGAGIPPEGWKLDAPKGATEAHPVAGPQLQFEEFQSIDTQGALIDVSHRLAGSKQLTDEEARLLSDPAHVLGGADHWNPASVNP